MTHPYQGKPDYQFWKRAGGIDDPLTLDPVVRTSFQIDKADKVVTAGSCFAQHVARRLANSGFNFHVSEPGHPLIPEALRKEHNYGLFSARYGNVYTARQLVQLILRAWDKKQPIDDVWQAHGGAFVDPFRPQIQPGGFVSPEEVRNDRRQHLAAVRDALTSADVFVFTLGLTEAWMDRRDGFVYPLAPGVAGGSYDPEFHAFVNFDVQQTIADMRQAITMLRNRNKKVRIILTVSPVPLNATAEDRHVLVSTTYSKSVLRVAAEAMTKQFEGIEYFPSYEIITSPHAGGAYYAADKREVTERGVDHVMGVFLRHYGAGFDATAESAPETTASTDRDKHAAELERAVEVMCDEVAIDNR